MPPNNKRRSEVIIESELPLETKPPVSPQKVTTTTDPPSPSTTPFQPRIIWFNVISITLFHLIALYALIFQIYKCKVISILYGFVVSQLGGFGVTGGVHRLWTHRSYKAKWPLRLILLFCYSIAGQNTVFKWVRDHRIHHKFSETDADPHNSNRGFFFAHVGWQIQRKHPEVLRRGAQVDMSDVLNDPLVSFHTKYFTPIKLLVCFILPTVIPVYGWGEDLMLAVYGMVFVRYIYGLNATWLVNSVAHIYGNKPYDTRIRPVQNWSVSVLAMGEGWHNYHHVFPWDYKAAELGTSPNVTTFLIDCFARIGWAYDLKTASPQLVQKVMEKHGDGSHPSLQQQEGDGSQHDSIEHEYELCSQPGVQFQKKDEYQAPLEPKQADGFLFSIQHQTHHEHQL